MSNEKQALLDKIAQLEARARQYATIRVAEKGGLSVYGLGRMPITLYASQWAKILSQGDQIRGEIVDNLDKLSFKDDKQRLDTMKLLGLEPEQPTTPAATADVPVAA